MPEAVESYARRIEWKGRIPKRRFLFTTRPEIERAEDSPRNIVIDPSIVFGRSAVAVTGIAAQTLYERSQQERRLARSWQTSASNSSR